MVKTVRWFLAVFGLQVLLSVSALTFAQIDPTKALIGTWDGLAETMRGGQEVTIVITKVSPKEEGSWIANGAFGQDKNKLGRRTFDVSQREGEIIVEFTMKADIPVRLKLVGDNKLEGTWKTVRPGGQWGTSGIKFGKIEPKAGDVK